MFTPILFSGVQAGGIVINENKRLLQLYLVLE